MKNEPLYPHITYRDNQPPPKKKRYTVTFWLLYLRSIDIQCSSWWFVILHQMAGLKVFVNWKNNL